VFKLDPENPSTPLMVLGEKGIPGDDHNHFCSPTDVITDHHGNIYISDGYVFCF